MTQTTDKKITLRPLGSRVVVQRLKNEEKTAGGIILPDSAKKKQETAKVIFVGPGVKDKEGKLTPMPVKEGDTVLLEKYSGQEVVIDDVEYVIVKAEDINAIVE